MNAHVLVAEDDQRQAEVLRRYLEAEGHTATVVHDGLSAVDQVRRRSPDVLILDVLMPGMDGREVCRVLRRDCDVLILMLTARAAEEDLLEGLDLGADDYLTKPYSPRELMARIRTLLRRARPAASSVISVGRLAVEPDRHEVAAGGVRVDCTAGEFAILAAMARQPGRVFTRAQLLAQTRGIDRSSTERTIDVHVMNLRRKIEADPRRPAMLLTVYGVGYKLVDGGGP